MSVQEMLKLVNGRCNVKQCYSLVPYLSIESDDTMSELVTHSTEPGLNAEPKPQDLVKNDVTPIDLFYHRNHGPVPKDAEAAFEQGKKGIDAWEVEVEVEDGLLDGGSEKKRVTLAQLKEKYQTVEEDIALQVRPCFPSIAHQTKTSLPSVRRKQT
jgi:hypothetical protein